MKPSPATFLLDLVVNWEYSFHLDLIKVGIEHTNLAPGLGNPVT